MSYMSSRLTTAVAGIALASLPVLGSAQGTPSSAQAPQQATPASQHDRSRLADQKSPQHHLDEARRVLAAISSDSTQIAELRRHFTQLESAWRITSARAARAAAAGAGHAGGHVSGTAGTTSGTPSATAAGTTGTPEQAGATGTPTARQAPPSGSATTQASDNWQTPYKAIDGTLDRLNDTSASVIGSIDAATRTKLVEFRRHLDQFNATAVTKGRVGEEDAASASASSGITGAMTETTPSTASTTPMPATTGTTGTTGSTPSAAADNAAIARLTADVDGLLQGSAATTTGTVCVDRAQLEQLRRDLQRLRR